MAASATWEIESILDTCVVFIRAHKQHYPKGQLMPGVFRKQGEGMSVDWAKYSTPDQTRSRAKIAADNAVIRLAVGPVRAIRPLAVCHSPTEENRSHTDVIGLPDNGEELTEMRESLLALAVTVLALDAAV
jgi:hypothetical protein